MWEKSDIKCSAPALRMYDEEIGKMVQLEEKSEMNYCICMVIFIIITLKKLIKIIEWLTEGSRCYIRLDFVRQFKLKKSCLTTFKSCDVRLGFSLTWKQQLSNIKLVKLNQENNYVRLMLILTKAFFLSFFLLKLKSSLTS